MNKTNKKDQNHNYIHEYQHIMYLNFLKFVNTENDNYIKYFGLSDYSNYYYYLQIDNVNPNFVSY